MPHWLRRYLNSSNLVVHFRRALVLGFVLRMLSAWFVYGPQALDDYKHGVYPAWQFFANLPLDLPDYRSHLLVWFLAGFVKVGVTSALGQVRAMYIGLGLTSLLGICGTYLYVREFRARIFGALALYLVAAFPLMPFVSTRAFGEAVAMSLVLLGFGFLEGVRRNEKRGWVRFGLYGFVSLGLATLFRFHVGLLYVLYAVILIAQKKWSGVIAAGIAGLFTLGSQALIDMWSGKEPLGTLLIYLTENEGGGAKYGVSPWYNPWLFVLLLTLAPFSFVLFGSVKNLARRHWPVLSAVLFFVFVHSLVAHKEERFLYPVVGLEMWLLAYLWSANGLNKWARRIYSPAFLFLCALALPALCLLNTQEGEIEPPAYAQARYGDVVYLDHESLFGKSRFQFYFLRPPDQLQTVEKTDFNAHRVDVALGENAAFKAAVLLTSDPEAEVQLEALAGIQTLEGDCGEVRAAGSLIDRVLYKLNPKHNQRRRPTWYLICERKSRGNV